MDGQCADGPVGCRFSPNSVARFVEGLPPGPVCHIRRTAWALGNLQGIGPHQKRSTVYLETQNGRQFFELAQAVVRVGTGVIEPNGDQGGRHGPDSAQTQVFGLLEDLHQSVHGQNAGVGVARAGMVGGDHHWQRRPEPVDLAVEEFTPHLF